jgi:ankyrin repeat protein
MHRRDFNLHFACRGSDLNKIRSAYNANPASLATANKLGFNPLILAIVKNNVPAVTFLLQKKESAAALKQYHMNYAIHSICKNNKEEMLNLLLQRKEVQDHVFTVESNKDSDYFANNEKISPLSVACHAGHIGIMKSLWGFVKDYHSHDELNLNALDYARGKSVAGFSPLDAYVKTSNHDLIIAYIEAHSGAVPTPEDPSVFGGAVAAAAPAVAVAAPAVAVAAPAVAAAAPAVAVAAPAVAVAAPAVAVAAPAVAVAAPAVVAVAAPAVVIKIKQLC